MGKKAVGGGATSIPIEFPCGKLTGSVGNDNHMTMTGVTGTATPLLNFNLTGVLGPVGFWAYFLRQPI